MAVAQYKLGFHPLVESDYADAYHWYEMRQKGMGERFLTNVRQKLLLIQQSPETYGVKSRKGYREAVVNGFPYVIVYAVSRSERMVFVSSVCHSRKHPAKKVRKRTT